MSDVQSALHDQIGRTRARIAFSRSSILRSRVRIADSRHTMIETADMLDLPELPYEIYEAGPRAADQRLIDREVWRTLMELRRCP